MPKPPVKIKLKKGSLTKHGYSSKKTERSRHISLKKAVLETSKTTVVRKLNAVKILNKNTNPKVSKVFKLDQEWVQKKF